MMLLPCGEGKCPICAVQHGPTDPHDATSLYYQYRFRGVRGRWPTWADALAHCDPDIYHAWKEVLVERGFWTESPIGVEPIADPPAESIRQAVGDPESRDFGPEDDT